MSQHVAACGGGCAVPRGRMTFATLIAVSVLLGLGSTAAGDGRAAAFMHAGVSGHVRLQSAGVLLGSDQPKFGLHATGARASRSPPCAGSGKAASFNLQAQLPGLRGPGNRFGELSHEVYRSLVLPQTEGRRPFGRTALWASTFSGGSLTDGDDYHYPEGSTQFVAECELPTDRGNFRMRAYSYRGAKVVVRDGENVLEWTEMEPVVIFKGNLRGSNNVVVRVHDQCYTSEVLGSKRCDCREQLELALDYINRHGGALIYMPQEGRGIGLANKIAAYQLQDGGLDTVDANRALGFGDDERCYACVPFMLKDMGITGIRLMTNNPFKIRQLTELGVTIVGAKSHVVAPNDFNAKYLRTKAARMAHALPDLEASTADEDTAPALAERTSKDTSANVRWRFGKKSVETAAKAVASGGAVMVVDGKRQNEGWLVAGASEITTSTLGLLSQLGDSICVPIAEHAAEALKVTGASCDAVGHLDDSADKQRGGATSQTRGLREDKVLLLRRVAAAATAAIHDRAALLMESLPPPLATVLQGEREAAAGLTAAPGGGLVGWAGVEAECLSQRLVPVYSREGSLAADTRSPGDAAVALARLSRLGPVAVMSPILTPDRLDLMSFAQVIYPDVLRLILPVCSWDLCCSLTLCSRQWSWRKSVGWQSRPWKTSCATRLATSSFPAFSRASEGPIAQLRRVDY